MDMIKENGIGVYILPKTFINTVSYKKLREIINNKYTILEIKNTDGGFLETKQDTVILILKNEKGDNSNYCYYKGKTLCFSTNNMNPAEKYKDYILLKDIEGIKITTGNIVWNQHKEILTNDKQDGILLIYPDNIIDNIFILKEKRKNKEKGQYIKEISKSSIKGKSIIIDRGVGNSNKFNYMLYDKKEYYCENHIYYIQHKDNGVLENIYKNLQKDYIKEYIKDYIGKKGITKEDLKYFPIEEKK
jgi:hypothetical protein